MTKVRINREKLEKYVKERDNKYFEQIDSGNEEVILLAVKAGGYFAFHKEIPGLCSSSFDKQEVVAKVMRYKEQYKSFPRTNGSQG